MIDLSEDKKELIISRLNQDIEAANAYYEEKIEPKVKERYDIYSASKAYYKKMFPHLSETSEVCMTDVRDTISSTLPSLMKTFFGSSDVVTVQGKDGQDEDNKKAETMQQLINFELERGGSYMKFSNWFTDALITNLGVIKVDWLRTYKPAQQQVQLNMLNAPQFIENAEQQGIKIDTVETDEATGTVLITYTKDVIDKNEPRLFNLPLSEFRFSPDATSLEDADFTAHKKTVSLDYLREQAESGLYDKKAVAELTEKASAPEYTTWDTSNNDHVSDQVNESDSGRRKTDIYECYVKLNLTDDPDGRLTDTIVTISNGIILRIEENTYERCPFFTLSPVSEPHKIIPEAGFVDLIAPIQHASTAILRQMITNMASSNDCRMAVDTTALVDVNDLLENSRYIRMNGGAQGINSVIQPLPVSPLQPWTFNMLEYLDNLKQNRTGITKYNQGMDSNSLNKTATGVNIITQQANMRLEQICRNFAETGIKDLFRFFIKLNQLFISEEMVIRLTNGPLKIAPDDLNGEFDLVVNAAMGASTKAQNIQNLQMVEAMVEKLVSVGLAGPQQIYNCFKKMMEELGYKNVDDFIIDPDIVAQQQAQAQQTVQQQQPQEQPKVSVNYNDLPWQAKAALLQSYGLPAEASWFAEKEQEDALREAVHSHAKADANKTHPGGLSDMATGMYLNQLGGQTV